MHHKKLTKALFLDLFIIYWYIFFNRKKENYHQKHITLGQTIFRTENAINELHIPNSYFSTSSISTNKIKKKHKKSEKKVNTKYEREKKISWIRDGFLFCSAKKRNEKEVKKMVYTGYVALTYIGMSMPTSIAQKLDHLQK